MWTVYCATYKDGRSYVGQTMRRLIDRIDSHYKCSLKNASSFGVFLKKTDPQDWSWKALKTTKSHREACHWEAFYIAKRKCFIDGFNSPTGHLGKLSGESREKMKMAKAGFVPWNKGKTNVYTQETLSRMAIAKMGKTPVRGKEWKENLTRAVQRSSGREVINLDTKEVYPSVAEAARAMGLAHSTVKRILNGKIKRSIYRIKYKS